MDNGWNGYKIGVRPRNRKTTINNIIVQLFDFIFDNNSFE